MKRFSFPFYVLLAALPILFSLSIHTGVLYYSKNITWRFGQEVSTKERVPARVVLDGRSNDGLKFQGTDRLDSFRAEDKMVYPSPEIAYRPVMPEVDFYPDAKVNDVLDIISIEAAARDNIWVNPSTGRQAVYTGPEKLVGSFSKHLQLLREGGLDVVFVFDATASMQSFLLEVKMKIEKLAVALKKLVPTCRIGLVAYRDTDDESGFVTRVFPLTYRTRTFRDFLADIDPIGGGEYEEAVYPAMGAAVRDMQWNKEAKKFILLIGDAPPHQEDVTPTLELVEAFRQDMGGTVAVLDTRSPEYQKALVPTGREKLSSRHYSYSQGSQDVLDEFQMIAQAGRGESARLDNEEKVVKKMLLLIFGERWEMYLHEFMKDL